MGANKAGDMTELCLIAEPNYGIITNIGKEHLEGFGGIEGVAASEGELFDYLASSNGHAFVNQDDEWVKKLAQSIHSQSPYAMNDGVLNLIHHVPNIAFDYQSVRIESPLMGLHNFQNIRACIEIAKTFDITPLQIQAGVEAYSPQNNRSQWVKGQSNNTILLDAYNANPSSVEMALRTFAAMPGSKWVLLGDMFELGNYEATEHQAICDLANSLSFDNIVLVGKAFAKVHLPNVNMKKFETVDDAQSYIKEQNPNNQLVLIKGSRGMKFKDLF
jgi:UDP-N-acetylmuramoyl-tripeptide--D-alanyl-D-alanine ligase